MVCDWVWRQESGEEKWQNLGEGEVDVRTREGGRNGGEKIAAAAMDGRGSRETGGYPILRICECDTNKSLSPGVGWKFTIGTTIR